MKEIKISKKVRGEDGHKLFSIRVPTALVERIDAIASNTDRSRNEVIVTLLSAAIENVTIEE